MADVDQARWGRAYDIFKLNVEFYYFDFLRRGVPLADDARDVLPLPLLVLTPIDQTGGFALQSLSAMYNTPGCECLFLYVMANRLIVQVDR